MKTFSAFLIENAINQRSSREEIQTAIKHYLNVGEVMNPVFKQISDSASRRFERDSNDSRKAILNIIHNHPEGRSVPEINTLYYDWPTNFRSLKKAEKAIAGLESLKREDFKPATDAARQIIDAWKPIGDDLAKLKEMVVKTATKREEVKAAAAKDMSNKMQDSSSLIKVLESHFGEYMKNAEHRIKESIKLRLDKLQSHDWDLNEIVPRKNHDKNSAAIRAMYTEITSVKGGNAYGSNPNIMMADPAKIARYTAASLDGAKQDYEDFVHKMITKIGKPVIDAKMVGNIWTDAVLSVTTNDGEEQVWHTKIIVNMSKYQKLFNQFPSRRTK